MKRYDIYAYTELHEEEDFEGDWVKYEDAKVLQELLNQWLNMRIVEKAGPEFFDLAIRTSEAVKDEA
jgi:hypothetical protein